jgi:hypothetical protein
MKPSRPNRLHYLHSVTFRANKQYALKVKIAGFDS